MSAWHAALTHCKRGHALAGDNVVIHHRANGRPYRNCRTCNNARARAVRNVPKTLIERIWRNVKQNENGCWIYTGDIARNGYGRISEGPNGGNVIHSTHAAMYREVFGPVPDGLQLDHTCHSFDETCDGSKPCPHRACCNPWHLEPVTARVNLLRGNGWSGRNARKTHCPAGHEYTPANTALEPTRGGYLGRKCRTCHRLREAARRERLAVSA